MRTTRKVLTAIVAAGIAAAGFSAATVAAPGDCTGPMGTMRGATRGASFDPAARAEARLTQFKTALKLTPAQEPLWQSFAEQAKSQAGKGMQAMLAQRQDLSLSAPERMAKMTELMKERLGVMESLHTAFSQLYDALTPEQKRVADVHAAQMAQRGPMGGRGGMGPHGQRGGPPWGGPGPATKG
jgi:hypothetical protein